MNLLTGDVVWAHLGPARGREQSGRRPIVVVASNDFLESVDTLVVGVPVTSRDRGWTNHVALTGGTGLTQPSFAMTEQLNTWSRERMIERAGSVDQATIERIRLYLRDFLGL